MLTISDNDICRLFYAGYSIASLVVLVAHVRGLKRREALAVVQWALYRYQLGGMQA